MERGRFRPLVILLQQDRADQLSDGSFVGKYVDNIAATRGKSDGAGAGRAPRTMDVTALLRACLAAIRLPPDAAALYRLPTLPAWSMGDATARIRALLPGVGEQGTALVAFLPERPSELAEPERWCRAAVASTFLAGLELTREGTITVQQETAWTTIQLRPGQAANREETADRTRA